MTNPPYQTAVGLYLPNITHGFFGREGGVSKGAHASLNTGPGSNDDQNDIAENRKRCTTALDVAPDRLVTNYQIHSAKAVFADGPWQGEPARADALVTTTPGLALGVLAADCMPWLFADPEAGVIGAAHAGWRGALAGVLENTVELMTRHGAEPSRIRAALGPCLRQPNFEVGLDLHDAFVSRHPESERFFAPGNTSEKRQLDLAGFGAWRLAQCDVTQLDDTNTCTLAEPSRYFSYRAAIRESHDKSAVDYGRNLSAIALY